ncbi:flagellar biosynthesis anti-sigma factor FlgM [Priestia megaterium]|uniref:flagellar biosynthesis anti-sigma factor FlgM n=1 Tax=Priestia megaterium TaxID=1404 RepID=UPI0005DD544D|nr:flagellar biosynthesis anti-sigma factor FlgM [Priestia megaterium]MED3979276.1 flagellar biosynthesis anti-sigma factor FlgM [Priestia megaterium]CJF93116.1 flagellar biosynthesis anti-sigma factor FlgM [Streptococcus pneumoniae]
MKINPSNLFGINPYKKPSEKTEQVSKKNPQDQIHISSEAKKLQGNEPSPERLEKLEKLKQQINSGTYEINGKEIAKGIVDFYKK